MCVIGLSRPLAQPGEGFPAASLENGCIRFDHE
jgi:hypothetical protein